MDPETAEITPKDMKLAERSKPHTERDLTTSTSASSTHDALLDKDAAKGTTESVVEYGTSTNDESRGHEFVSTLPEGDNVGQKGTKYSDTPTRNCGARRERR